VKNYPLENQVVIAYKLDKTNYIQQRKSKILLHVIALETGMIVTE